MALLQDRALLLRRIAYGETSLICHFLSERHGRIALMAKGARRAKSPFRATLQPLHELQIDWRSGRTGMGTLTDVQRGSPLLQESAMLAGQELLAIAAGLFQEGDPHGFEELRDALAVLCNARSEALSAAVWHLLKLAGWLGDMDHCWHCGDSVSGPLFWRHAQLICGNCGGGSEISPGLQKSIRAALAGERIQFSAHDDRIWRQMIGSVLSEHGIRSTESFHA